MSEFANCTLKMRFRYGSCNNKLLQVEVEHNQKKVKLSPVENFATYTKQITLPTTLKVSVTGKDTVTDTKVDADGNVIEDLFVEICDITLDTFRLSDFFLHKKITIQTEDGKDHNTNYFGNGSANIDFLEENIFAQVYKAAQE
jgi:hypothetical protein